MPTAVIEMSSESMICDIEAEEQIVPTSSIPTKTQSISVKTLKIARELIPQKLIQINNFVTKRDGIQILSSRMMTIMIVGYLLRC